MKTWMWVVLSIGLSAVVVCGCAGVIGIVVALNMAERANDARAMTNYVMRTAADSSRVTVEEFERCPVVYQSRDSTAVAATVREGDNFGPVVFVLQNGQVVASGPYHKELGLLGSAAGAKVPTVNIGVIFK